MQVTQRIEYLSSVGEKWNVKVKMGIEFAIDMMLFGRQQLEVKCNTYRAHRPAALACPEMHSINYSCTVKANTDANVAWR